MKNQLIPVINGELSGEQVQLVDARELHQFLESKQDFSTWIKKRIADYGFLQNIDFKVPQKNGAIESIGYAQDRIDYQLTIEMAKELGMVERNEKGREIRKYFIEVERIAKLEHAKKNKQTTDIVRVSKVSKALISLARAYGLKGNQALLSADTATKNLEGISPLALLGISLQSDVKRKLLTPSEIGLQIGGLSAQKVNKLLLGLGYQVKIDDQWEPTLKGQMLGEMLDTHKKHTDGTPVKQWKWYSSIIDEIATTEAA
jgi:phage anti-repressor protein